MGATVLAGFDARAVPNPSPRIRAVVGGFVAQRRRRRGFRYGFGSAKSSANRRRLNSSLRNMSIGISASGPWASPSVATA